ncbi:hypothetical protein N7462_009299 [Penicillium macrosclerotiorum]|uniref:uncharacterized protein n=1 Tax=Penicillium macrosclerotiorum TaxID=303699 RepID=UPI002548FB88|nr:uncharacterized protein N7462_009299 [Penicillium macrosclerotiorum]KAJ5673860.1 hypothetical protein N7462_009299 [Penicillium macrosclerotiorum]
MYLIYAATFRRSAGERQYELVTFLYMRTKTTWGSYMFTGEGSMYVHRQDRKGNRQILRIDEVDPFTWVESETQPRDIYKSHSTRCLGVYRAAEDKGEEWALNNLLPSAVEYYEQAQLRGTRGVDQQFVQTLRKLPPNSIAWTREGRKVIDNEEYNPPKLSRGTQQHTQQQQAQAYMFRPGAQRLRKRNPDDKVEILNR